MKKFLLSACLLLVSVPTFAQQKGKVSVGAGLSLRTLESSVGIGAKARYGLSDRIRLEGAVNYFLPKNDASSFDVGVNGHYLFNLNEQWTLYPLAGIGYYHYKTSYSYSYSYTKEFEKTLNYLGSIGSTVNAANSSSSGAFLINLGAGVSYQLSRTLSVGAEVKYQLISGLNSPSVGVNAMFSL